MLKHYQPDRSAPVNNVCHTLQSRWCVFYHLSVNQGNFLYPPLDETFSNRNARNI